MEEQLLKAIKARDFPLVEELIRNGADVNYLFETGVDPIYWAVTEDDIEMVKLLLQHNVVITRIYDKRKYSLLHYAAENYEIAKMLLESGIEVDARDIYGNTSLWTALHQARLTGGKYDVVELLLQHGADPYSKNRVGEILVGKKKEPLGESLSPFIVSTREGRQNELDLFEKYKNVKDAK